MAVRLHTAPMGTLPSRDVEGENRGVVTLPHIALVVVCHVAQRPFSHRQDRVAAIERMDLAFLVDAEEHSRGRGSTQRPTKSVSLSESWGSLEILHVRTRCG